MINKSIQNSSGFTLIELLITIVIVGILASVAYPSYRDNVRQANRSEAIAELQSLLAAQERYFLQNREYADDLTELGFASATLSIDNYAIQARACSDAGADIDMSLCGEIIASATGDQENDGDIVMNSIGRSELVEHGTNNVKEQF